jgi:broad specificity phosphatase PhoE
MRTSRGMVWLAVVVAGWLAGPMGSPASAQEVVFVVRHAERADTSSDSALSPVGELRAAHLAEHLRHAGVTAVFSTPYRRTLGTAAPLATNCGLAIVQIPGSQPTELLDRVRALGPKARVLIVGHSNTVPALLAALGATAPVTIADDEYDNLFVVIPGAGTEPTVVRLRY